MFDRVVIVPIGVDRQGAARTSGARTREGSCPPLSTLCLLLIALAALLELSIGEKTAALRSPTRADGVGPPSSEEAGAGTSSGAEATSALEPPRER